MKKIVWAALVVINRVACTTTKTCSCTVLRCGEKAPSCHCGSCAGAVCHEVADIPGFTLIEMSIVLVIIGLIVGGILVGRDLIHAAELRSVLTDVEKFKTAAMTFQGKYNCLPGDCANATTFFGTTDSQGNPIHNGNGNGVLDDQFDYSNMDGPVALSEPQWVWQQLSLAGLIPGYYNGYALPNLPWGFWADPDLTYWWAVVPNAPGSKISNGVYAILSPDAAVDGGSVATMYSAHYGNMIILGNSSPAGGSLFPPYGPVLSPQDAYALDSKIDDGIPSSGM